MLDQFPRGNLIQHVTKIEYIYCLLKIDQMKSVYRGTKIDLRSTIQLQYHLSVKFLFSFQSFFYDQRHMRIRLVHLLLSNHSISICILHVIEKWVPMNGLPPLNSVLKKAVMLK